mgnify:FL=1
MAINLKSDRKWLIISILVICAVVIGLFWYRPALPQIEAEKLAAIRLDKYAKEVSLPIEEFVRERVEYQDKVWQVVYRSKKKPVHVLSILVDNFRNVELHRYIESSP